MHPTSKPTAIKNTRPCTPNRAKWAFGDAQYRGLGKQLRGAQRKKPTKKCPANALAGSAKLAVQHAARTRHATTLSALQAKKITPPCLPLGVSLLFFRSGEPACSAHLAPCQHFANTLPTLCQHFANTLPTDANA